MKPLRWVRRRLFGGIRDEAARDQVCEAFSRMYAILAEIIPKRSVNHVIWNA